jgi:hypothetical protein
MVILVNVIAIDPRLSVPVVADLSRHSPDAQWAESNYVNDLTMCSSRVAVASSMLSVRFGRRHGSSLRPLAAHTTTDLMVAGGGIPSNGLLL